MICLFLCSLHLVVVGYHFYHCLSDNQWWPSTKVCRSRQLANGPWLLAGTSDCFRHNAYHMPPNFCSIKFCKKSKFSVKANFCKNKFIIPYQFVKIYSYLATMWSYNDESLNKQEALSKALMWQLGTNLMCPGPIFMQSTFIDFNLNSPWRRAFVLKARMLLHKNRIWSQETR